MSQHITSNQPRQRRRAVDLISGAISVALFSGFTWWFLTLVADHGAGVI